MVQRVKKNCLDYLHLLHPPACDWASQHYKRQQMSNISFSGIDGKAQTLIFLMRLTWVRNGLLPNFFPAFSNLISHQKGIYFQ